MGVRLALAEIYVTILTGFCLGHLLHYGREVSAMDQVIGIMLVIIIIGPVTDKRCSRLGSVSCTGAGALESCGSHACFFRIAVRSSALALKDAGPLASEAGGGPLAQTD
jgi:hypothetical protein